jgi:hypothetical protein
MTCICKHKYPFRNSPSLPQVFASSGRDISHLNVHRLPHNESEFWQQQITTCKAFWLHDISDVRINRNRERKINKLSFEPHKKLGKFLSSKKQVNKKE